MCFSGLLPRGLGVCVPVSSFSFSFIVILLFSFLEKAPRLTPPPCAHHDTWDETIMSRVKKLSLDFILGGTQWSHNPPPGSKRWRRAFPWKAAGKTLQCQSGVVAPGGGKAGWGKGSSSGTACNNHKMGVWAGHDGCKEREEQADEPKLIIALQKMNNYTLNTGKHMLHPWCK